MFFNFGHLHTQLVVQHQAITMEYICLSLLDTHVKYLCFLLIKYTSYVTPDKIIYEKLHCWYHFQSLLIKREFSKLEIVETAKLTVETIADGDGRQKRTKRAGEKMPGLTMQENHEQIEK